MNSVPTRSWKFWMGTAAALAVASASFAQSEARPSPPGEPPAATRPGSDRAVDAPVSPEVERQRLRELLQRRLERLRRAEETIREQQESLSKAVALMERGGSLEDVRKLLGDSARDRFTDRPAPEQRGPAGGERGREPGPAGPGREGVGPARGPEMGRDPQPPMRRIFQDEEVRRIVLEMVAEHDRPLAEELARLIRENPERAEAFIRERAPRILEVLKQRHADPERFDAWRRAAHLEAQNRELIGVIRGQDATASAREEATRALRSNLEQQFELRFQMQQREMERLAERLEQLRAEMQRFAEQRQATVDRRLLEMIEGGDDAAPRRDFEPQDQRRERRRDHRPE